MFLVLFKRAFSTLLFIHNCVCRVILIVYDVIYTFMVALIVSSPNCICIAMVIVAQSLLVQLFVRLVARLQKGSMFGPYKYKAYTKILVRLIISLVYGSVVDPTDGSYKAPFLDVRNALFLDILGCRAGSVVAVEWLSIRRPAWFHFMQMLLTLLPGPGPVPKIRPVPLEPVARTLSRNYL